MRNITTSFCINNNFLMVFFLLSLFGCAGKSTVLPEVSVYPTIQYKYCQEQEGLSVAIDPFFEGEKVKTYFAIDLLSQGILPVLIVIENHNSESGYLLEKKYFFLSKKNTKNNESEVAAKNREPSVPYSEGSIKSKNAVLPLGVVGIIWPVMFVPAMILDVSSSKQIANVNIVNDNLMKKAFIDKSIFPGETHSGFIYFQMKDEVEIKNVIAITIKTKNMLLDKELSFNFKIQN